jgi:transposase InsO family protein
MSRELRKRGTKVNRKRLQRLMREDNLLCVAKRKFVVTTDSAHPLPVYPNLPPKMNVTGINQLWIADIRKPVPASMMTITPAASHHQLNRGKEDLTG